MDNFSKHSLDILRKDAHAYINGVQRGIVEDIDDPDRLGRAKVRVWAIHGDKYRTPTTSLPWAEIAEIGGGGYDYGSFNPPPVGSAVWVAFEDGHKDYPVIFGTFRGIPKRDDENQNMFLTNDGRPNTERAWSPPNDETETPKDVFDGVYDSDPHPTRRIWNKSYKGHTIIIEDGDGKEFLKIIDRSGQVIEMQCPVAEEYSSANQAQRGVRDAVRGDQMPHAAMRDKRAIIRIRDLSGQEIVLDAKDQNEQIKITGRNRIGSSFNSIEISSGSGKDLIKIEDASGSNLSLEPSGNNTISLSDSVGNSIKFNKNDGSIKVVPYKLYQEESSQKLEIVSGKKESEINGDLIERIQGNKKSNVVNDLSLGVLGNSSLTLGGSLDVAITNQSLTSGLPSNGVTINLAQLLGCDFELASLNGAIKLNTQTGNIELEVKTLGDITLTTTKGNATLETISGNVSAKTLSGNAELLTGLGTANVDGTTVHLGAISYVEPLLKGMSAYTAISTKNTTISSTLPTLISTSAALLSACAGPPPATLFAQISAQFITWLTSLSAFVTSMSLAFPAESTALLNALSVKSYTE